MKQVLRLSAYAAGIWLLFVVAVSVATSCGPALEAVDAIQQERLKGVGCDPTDSICDGNTLMLCNADHEWEVNTNCGDYETPRQCCEIIGDAGCYKADECEEEEYVD